MKDQDFTKRDPCMDWTSEDSFKVEGNNAIAKSLSLLEFWSSFFVWIHCPRKIK